MERMILRTLAFDVSSPTANWFCLYLLKEMDAAEKDSFLTMVSSLIVASTYAFIFNAPLLSCRFCRTTESKD